MPQFVLTLIAADHARGVADEAGRAIAAALDAPIDWLAPGIAGDISIAGMAAGDAERAARAVLPPGARIDLAVQPVERRRKRLLVADLESTIIENEMLVEMADAIGARERVADITRRAMNGEIDFAAALEARVALFRGQPQSLLDDMAARIRVTPGAAALVRTMAAHGARAILVSGGFTVFANRIRDALGFDRAEANELIVADGRLAGTVRQPILDADAKRAALLRAAAEFGLDPAETLAVGDGANDLPMLHAAGLGVAFHAKPHVREQAATRIDHADLTALLYLQGYRPGDFVAPG